MHKFYDSSFGSFLDELFSGILTSRSHENLLILSLGLLFAFTRQR